MWEGIVDIKQLKEQMTVGICFSLPSIQTFIWLTSGKFYDKALLWEMEDGRG